MLALARRPGVPEGPKETVEQSLHLLVLVALEDPPRAGAKATSRPAVELTSVARLSRRDHSGTARAMAVQVGIIQQDGPVLEVHQLPMEEAELARLIDRDVVVARVTADDKLRLARALQSLGHVVAMTGDGVRDGPALRQADIGFAIGASGSGARSTKNAPPRVLAPRWYRLPMGGNPLAGPAPFGPVAADQGSGGAVVRKLRRRAR